MFKRRIRTLTDQFLATTYFHDRIDELVALLATDAPADQARWGANAFFGAADYTLQAANDRIKTEYLAPRLPYLIIYHAQPIGGGGITTFVDESAPVAAFVPVDGSLGQSWTALGFDDASWVAGTNGVGYDEDVTYAPFLGTDLRGAGVPAGQRIDTDGDGTSENDSAYVRIPFSVADASAVPALILRVRYDDGFVAYLNGTEVARANAPAAPQWNSAATALHDDGAALVYQSFDISGAIGLLNDGANNVLALHALNDATNGTGTSSDMLLAATLADGIESGVGAVGIPASQPEAPPMQIGAVEFSPASGDQDEEYFEILNPNAYAADISGWQISGAVDFTFKAGTVVLPGETLYVAKDVAAWRGRAAGPTGGEGHFVQGGYSGQLSARGEDLILTNPQGAVVDQASYPGAPSPAQEFLRVSEINFHPADPTPAEIDAGFADDGLFEFVELVNIGSAPLDLEGAAFIEGIDFTFPAAAALAPGQAILVVKNAAAFAFRYGAGLPVAGEFGGQLDNSGETLVLVDAVGENILKFSYTDEFFAPADGGGRTLVIRDPAGDWQSWDDPASWAVSAALGGSPGNAENAQAMTFAIWQLQEFDAAERADENVSGPNANNDGDDLPAWLEYALGLNPHAADGIPLGEVIFADDGGQTYLAVEFRRRPNALDLTYDPRVSTDLSEWETMVDQVGGAEVLGGGIERVVFRAAAAAGDETEQFAAHAIIWNP
ncbi:MAG: lamin tail domain-containing protein [Verrucomicrobiales bacterium]